MHHAETENRKEQIYKLLCEQKMTVLQVMRKTGYSESKVHNYLRRLHLGEHVIVEKIFERGRYINLYRANKRKHYVKKVILNQPSETDLIARRIEEKNLQEQKELREEKNPRVLTISPTTRIIRLLDAPLAPAPRTKKHVDYGIGSSFAMYDSY
jgi:DNA-binding transcriptional regulator GbsR (MarR family)